MLAVRASLEQFKGSWLAPIHSLEGLLLIRAPVAPEVAWLWRVKQFDDFLLQGSPLRQLLFSAVLLLGPSRPILRGAEPKLFEAVI